MQPLSDERRGLLVAKLGRFVDWSAPELVPTIGPSDPSVFHEFHASIQPVIEACADRLMSYPDDQIQALVNDNVCDIGDLGEDWNKFAASEIKQLEHNEPPWFAGGFGHPDYQADFAYWARMPRFSIAEITCLSVGIKPETFSQAQLDKLARQKSDTLWPAIDFLDYRYKQLVRQFGENGRVSAYRFALWAMRLEFDMPERFLDLLKRYHVASNAENAKQTEPRREDKREIDKVAQLFAAMAIEYFGYDPKQAKSSVPREVADLAASMGLSISDDTVRKYLKIGAKFISKDWKPRMH